METQSAFMAAAAASVILVATLVNRRDRTAILFAALTLAFGLYSFGRGGQHDNRMGDREVAQTDRIG